MTNVRFESEAGIATVTLDRPGRKNSLTFDAYGRLQNFFETLPARTDVKAVVLTGAGGDFSSGGDVREIIGPLTRAAPDELRAFTRMTGSVVKAMRACPQPIIAAVDGACAGVGAALATASDLRYGTARARVAFLFVRVGLGGCDMGATAMLPRIVGLGRASELLYTGRAMTGEEGLAWGFFNALHEPAQLLREAHTLARALAAGPTRAHASTKHMLHAELAMDVDSAIDLEADAQAELMHGNDFRRAYEAFVEKRAPVFEGD